MPAEGGLAGWCSEPIPCSYTAEQERLYLEAIGIGALDPTAGPGSAAAVPPPPTIASALVIGALDRVIGQILPGGLAQRERESGLGEGVPIQVLHARQRFAFHRPLAAGREYLARARVERDATRRGMRYVEVAVEIREAALAGVAGAGGGDAGALCAEGRSTLIVQGGGPA